MIRRFKMRRALRQHEQSMSQAEVAYSADHGEWVVVYDGKSVHFSVAIQNQDKRLQDMGMDAGILNGRIRRSPFGWVMV